MLPEIMALQKMIHDKEHLSHEYKQRGGGMQYRQFYNDEEAEQLRELEYNEEVRRYEAMLEEYRFEQQVRLSNLEYEYFSFPADE